MDPYEGDPIKRPFRVKWPWEQDRQMALYHKDSTLIQVASHPEKPEMDRHAGVKDWCLSHLPGSGCFISHHCEGPKSKQNLIAKYALKTVFDDKEFQLNLLTTN